jgi:hypothetical protein
MGPGGTLRMVFEADAWDSTISFAAGIPVTRGGTLELTFADDTSLTTQIGRTFDVFDWTGVTPTGTFAVSSAHLWDLSNLYSTGDVTLLAAGGIPGDFNLDNVVDGADYVVWRKGLGTTYTQADYNTWRANFGRTAGGGAGAGANVVVPEPSIIALVAINLVASLAFARNVARQNTISFT